MSMPFSFTVSVWKNSGTDSSVAQAYTAVKPHRLRGGDLGLLGALDRLHRLAVAAAHRHAVHLHHLGGGVEHVRLALFPARLLDAEVALELVQPVRLVAD